MNFDTRPLTFYPGVSSEGRLYKIMPVARKVQAGCGPRAATSLPLISDADSDLWDKGSTSFLAAQWSPMSPKKKEASKWCKQSGIALDCLGKRWAVIHCSCLSRVGGHSDAATESSIAEPAFHKVVVLMISCDPSSTVTSFSVGLAMCHWLLTAWNGDRHAMAWVSCFWPLQTGWLLWET